MQKRFVKESVLPVPERRGAHAPSEQRGRDYDGCPVLGYAAFVGEFLEILHAISRQKIERMPSFIIELHTLSGHRGSSRFPS
jgi:hypothetical protein